MKQVIARRGQICVEETPVPVLQPGCVLVRVHHSVISTGTESRLAIGGVAQKVVQSALTPPLRKKFVQRLKRLGLRSTLSAVQEKLTAGEAVGYSSAGVIEAVGEGVEGLCVGDRVACAGVGFACHAEWNLVPAPMITAVPRNVSLEDAAFVALGAIAMHAVRRAAVTFGETVVILGLGCIGQLAAQMARVAGCRVIGCDVQSGRCEVAVELGAERAVPPSALYATVSEITDGNGADAVLVCASTPESEVTRTALELCRHKGRVIVVGDVGLELNREPLYRKELDFSVSCSYGPGRYDPRFEQEGIDYPLGYVRWTERRNMQEFIRLLADAKVCVNPLIGQRFPIEQAATAFEAARHLHGKAVVVALFYPTESAKPASSSVAVRPRSPRAGTVGVAVLGAGRFAGAQHLPNLLRLRETSLEFVVTKNPHEAREAAERFGAAYASTDYREALASDRVHAVIIATRHHLHGEMALAALNAGKHVLVEKPLALTQEECEAVVKRCEETGLLCAVGFNRRFSTLADAMKQAVAHLAQPRMIVYRIDAGVLPPDHWTLDPLEGGGRILGEAVHFLDWCCWFAEEEPTSVQAARLGPSPIARAEDNLGILLRFPGGTLANIVYSSIGSSELGKERIEIFCGGGTAYLEDWRELRFSNLPGRNVSQRVENKGHFALLQNFIRAVQGKEPLRVTAVDGLRATRLALRALDAATGHAL